MQLSVPYSTCLAFTARFPPSLESISPLSNPKSPNAIYENPKIVLDIWQKYFLGGSGESNLGPLMSNAKAYSILPLY
jgi:hypothetical protein